MNFPRLLTTDDPEMSARFLLGLLLCASADALRFGSTTSRRAIILSAPAAALPFAANAADKNSKVGYACRGDVDCGVDSAAVRALTATPGQGEAAGIRFAGTYSDPAYPGLPRKVQLAGTNVIITGVDEKGAKEWKVKGKPVGRALVLDYSSKGGPKQVIARWTGLGLAFEDGSTWTKK